MDNPLGKESGKGTAVLEEFNEETSLTDDRNKTITPANENLSKAPDCLFTAEEKKNTNTGITPIDSSKVQCVLLDLKKENEWLASEISHFQDNFVTSFHNLKKNAQESIDSLERVYLSDSQEKRELLSEMTGMNEELNRRGETISSLKEVVSMYEKKVIDFKSELDCSLSTTKQVRDELTDRTLRLQDLSTQQETNSNIICQLKGELANTREQLQDLDSQQNVSNNTIKQLRDQLTETSQQLVHSTAVGRDLEAEVIRLRDHHVEGDHLSTSTVSKTEEAGRLKDVEDSFEDRYCKLKVVAVKLKKRLTETQQQLESDRQKWASDKNDLVNKLNQLTASARNNQTVQQECDRLADELEAERKECKVLRKAATDAKVSEVALKVKLEEAQTNIEILKVNLDSAVNDRDNLNQKLATKEAELELAVKEKIAEELIRKEKSREVAELEEKLKEEQDKLNKMQKTVESAKVEVRKQGVLSLEIQNYEKSLSDMSDHLNVEKSRVSSLEAEVQTLQDIRDSLQEQIRLLEERVATEEARCQQAQVQLVQSRSCLEEAQHNVLQLESQVSQLTQRLESERTSAEAATLELASLSSAIQTNTDIMLREKQDLSQQVTSLTSQLASESSALKLTQSELAELQSDFEKYKVRAQSVLRKHQSSATSLAETEAKQQVDEFKQLIDSLKTKLDDSVSQIEKLQNDLDVANNERDSAETRCVNLNVALAEKTRQLERAIAEHRSQRLSLDTLVQCYKSQLEEKEKAGLEQVQRLTEELETLKVQLKERLELATTLPDSPAVAGQAARPDPLLLEREDGEGSEYIPEYSPSNSPVPASHKPLLPLDKLLETRDTGDHEMEGEMSAVKAELERTRKRAQHQAALLAEAEQDAARKEQLIAVLKTEVGRLERCLLRQPHAQNTEYLKNIVFKFVTLGIGEDRMRLVPVITTLLQLSPEETQKLSAIAKVSSVINGSGHLD